MKEFGKILILILPIFIVFISYGLLGGEQFFIFRGNYWDNMNYISTSMLINEMNINEIYKLEKNPVNEGNAVIYNGSKNILFRPLISAVLAQLFNFKIIGYFFTTYFFKAILMSKLFLSFYFLLNQIQIKHKYTLSLIFTFSFCS